MLATAYGYGNNPVIRQTSVSLADMLKVLADHVADFNQLLIEPRSVVKTIITIIIIIKKNIYNKKYNHSLIQVSVHIYIFILFYFNLFIVWAN